MNSVRVRYGRDNKNAPKNTLVTIRLILFKMLKRYKLYMMN